MFPAAVSSTGAVRLQRGSSLGFGETPDRSMYNPAQAPLADREVLRCANCMPPLLATLTPLLNLVH